VTELDLELSVRFHWAAIIVRDGVDQQTERTEALTSPCGWMYAVGMIEGSGSLSLSPRGGSRESLQALPEASGRKVPYKEPFKREFCDEFLNDSE
jgi:hypothetical protein